MQSRQNFWTLTKKEFLGIVNSPLAYLIMVPFLIISHFLFFRTALVIGDANLRPFIEILPWFMVVLAPALTMKAFTDEYKKGTIELLFSYPVSEWVVVGSKYAGLLLFYLVMLMTTIMLPIVLMLFSDPDIGLMMSQYAGAFIMGAVFLAVGMAVSSYIKSSVGSFLVGAAICFGLLLVGLNFVVLGVPAPLNRILVDVGIVSHVNNLARGVVDLRDILYFVTIIGVALTAAVMKLSQRKLAESPKEKTKLWVMIGLILGIGMALNVLMAAYPLRGDLTANQRFSMSSGTKKMLKELPDRVTLTLYTSQNLPGPMQITLRETSDRLKDFGRYGGGSVRVNTEVIDVADPAAKAEIIQKGIQDITFNQIGAGNLQVQSGLLGLEVRYGDKTEVIPFVEDASNLEYQLARLILKMTRDEQAKIGLLDATSTGLLSTLNEILSQQYEVIPINDEVEIDWEELAEVIVVDDGSQPNATAAAALNSYLQNNGHALFLTDGVYIDQQYLATSESKSELRKILGDYGVQVNTDLVYDLQQNETIMLPTEPLPSRMQYPFWVWSNLNPESVPWTNAGNANVLLGWPSSISVNEQAAFSIKPLLATGLAGGKQESSYMVRPDQLSALQPGREPIPMGAIIEKGNQRLAVVADSQIVLDEFLQNALSNRVFINNLVDWTAADEVLTTIPQRTAGRTLFKFTDPNQVKIVQYAATIIPPLLVALFGLFWLSRRRKLTRREWKG